MLLWFKMVVYKFTEKMRGCSALWLQGLDFSQFLPWIYASCSPKFPFFPARWHPGIWLMLVSSKGIIKRWCGGILRGQDVSAEIDVLTLGWWFAVGIAGAGEEVAVPIRLLIEASALLSSLARVIYKIIDALIDTSGSNGRGKGDSPHPVQGLPE